MMIGRRAFLALTAGAASLLALPRALLAGPKAPPYVRWPIDYDGQNWYTDFEDNRICFGASWRARDPHREPHHYDGQYHLFLPAFLGSDATEAQRLITLLNAELEAIRVDFGFPRQLIEWACERDRRARWVRTVEGGWQPYWPRHGGEPMLGFAFPPEVG